jgi:hypothetical protein
MLESPDECLRKGSAILGPVLEAQFDDLKFDLEHFATAFLLENAEEFSRCAAGTNEWKSRPGFSRLP